VNLHDTPAEPTPDLQLEIAYILLIDVVGYSKLLVNEQVKLLQRLNEIVRSTECFRAAEARGELIRVPTGDGMALVFFHSPEEPAQCALEISKALQDHPSIRLRMGVHSGPVGRVTDVNEKTNIAGSGINIAQRVLDCGDAGHILLSAHVADDLADYRHWQPHLHDLGECEVKYGLHLHLFNLYRDGLGNPQVPEKLRRGRRKHAPAVSVRPITAPRLPRVVLQIALVVSAVALVISSLIFLNRAPPTTVKRALRAQAAIPKKSIAVLPFENLSDEKENAYFADGVQGEILIGLSRVADLKVISRTSVMHYQSGVARNLREIGQQLGVSNVVVGSVQRSGNRVRVNAQLVDARSDRQLWGQTYDRDLADVFAIQSQIATAIADQLQAKLSPGEKSGIERPPTGDIAAFDLYTQARNLLSAPIFSATGDANLLRAIDLLNQAVTRDPSFFQAYCQLAYAHDLLYFLGNDRTAARLGMADAAIQAASRLLPDAGETHLARAENLYRGYLNYDDALAELKAAARTLPNDPRVFELEGYIERRQGRWEDARRSLERAADLDPRNVFILEQLALSHQLLRHYAEAESVLDRILSIEPNNLEIQAARAFVDLDWKADTRPLRQLIDKIRATNPDDTQNIANYWLFCALAERDVRGAKDALIASGENPITLANENVVLNGSFVEGVIARMANDGAKARSAFNAAQLEQEKILQSQPNYGPALCVLGLIDAGLGRKEEALREGSRAVELLPVKKDAVGGVEIVKYLAVIAAWVGDKGLACEQLASVTNRPSSISYGQLKLLPFWDTLRGDPRSEKIVASLAPK